MIFGLQSDHDCMKVLQHTSCYLPHLLGGQAMHRRESRSHVLQNKKEKGGMNESHASLEKERDQLANALERLADVQRQLAEGQRSLMTGQPMALHPSSCS